MRPAFVIAQKDLRQRIRDRSAIVLAIVAPFGLAAILGSVLPADEDRFEPHSYAVVDADGGPVSQTFMDDVLAGFAEDESVDLVDAESKAEARTLAADGEIAAAFFVPAGFSAAVQSNQPARIEVIGSADAPIATQIAEAVATSFASELNAVRLSISTLSTIQGGPPDDPAALADRAAQVDVPVELHRDPAATRELDAKTRVAAGMAVFFLFFTAQFGVLSLLGERSEGTLSRLLAAPISPASIVTAKALSTFVFGTVSMVVLVVASTFLLGADWGEPFPVALLIIAGVIAAMGVTTFVGGMAKTVEQAAGYSSIIAVVLGILGGTFFPLSQAPTAIATLSKLTPHYWLLRGFGDLGVEGAGVGDALPLLIVPTAFGVVFGVIGLWRARRMVAG